MNENKKKFLVLSSVIIKANNKLEACQLVENIFDQEGITMDKVNAMEELFWCNHMNPNSDGYEGYLGNTHWNYCPECGEKKPSQEPKEDSWCKHGYPPEHLEFCPECSK